MINLLENTPNQPRKCRRKSWVEVNEELRGTYNVNCQIEFKTLILGQFYVIIVMRIYL